MNTINPLFLMFLIVFFGFWEFLLIREGIRGIKNKRCIVLGPHIFLYQVTGTKATIWGFLYIMLSFILCFVFFISLMAII